MPRLALVAALAALAVAFSAGGLAIANASTSASPGGGTVEVTGTSTILARPDTVTVDMTVQVIRTVSSAALSKDNVEMAALQRVFLRAGVSAKSLTTTSLTVGPNYDSNGKPAGYVARHSLEVSLNDLATAGALIGRAQASVGNDVSVDGVTYSLVNMNGVLNNARAAAARNARSAATALALASGSRVVGVSRITDQSTSTTPIVFYNRALPSAGVAASTVPLKSGTQSVTASVDVVFQIAN